MIPIPDVPLLLRGWAEDKRLLRVVARLGGVDFSAFCRVASTTDDSFALRIGSDARDMIGFSLDGWVFGFGDAPPVDNEIMGEEIESAVVGTHRGLSLMIFLLKQ